MHLLFEDYESISKCLPPNKDIDKSFINIIKSRIDIAKEHGSQLVFVFDRATHEMKSFTRSKRNKTTTRKY